MHEIIKKYLEYGISLVPTGADKRALIKWEPYQRSLPTFADADQWELPIAAIGGMVSGGLVCIDFDDKGSAFDDWAYAVCLQRPELMSKLVIQQTPSGGRHCIYRCVSQISNIKLADRYPTIEEAAGGEKRKKIGLIETRGEGGYFIIDPSPGYKLLQNSFTEIEQIDVVEHECMITCARAMNLVKDETPNKNSIITPTIKGISPFDDFDSKHDPLDTLKDAGWSIVFNKSNITYLRRPGKNTGISASWNKIPDRLYVFTTSTEFENEHIYKSSAVYAILKHRGDYSAAAKELSQKGYGKKEESKPVSLDNSFKTQIVKSSDFKNKILEYYSRKQKKGFEIGLPEFSRHLRIEKGQLNVVTGIPTAGKSMFMDFITVQMSQVHNWKWAIFSPENYPIEIHFNKIATSHLSRRPQNEQDILSEVAYIDAHYRFIDATEDELTIENIMANVLDCKNSFGVDGLVIDPWNEIESSRPRDISETDYIGVCLRKLRKFARKNNISLWIVAHPTKLQRDKKTGEYPVVSLYDISSSANWYNKVDNGIIVHRKDDLVAIIISKVKYRDFGSPGTIAMKYDFPSGQYQELADQTLNPMDF